MDLRNTGSVFPKEYRSLFTESHKMQQNASVQGGYIQDYLWKGKWDPWEKHVAVSVTAIVISEGIK